jgi:hypothetical protein
MLIWLITLAAAASCAYALWSLWKSYTDDPVQVLLRQATRMNWVQTATVEKDGQGAVWTKRSIRLRRNDEEAVIWYKNATITLVRVPRPETFKTFVELEQSLAENQENNDDDETPHEKLYLCEIERFVIRHGYYQSLLEVQGTDETFCIASFKLYKVGYLADEAPTVIAALTLDALSQYHEDRRRSLEFLIWMENDYRSTLPPMSELEVAQKQRAPAAIINKAEDGALSGTSQWARTGAQIEPRSSLNPHLDVQASGDAKKPSHFTARDIIRVFVLSMAGPIILSATGPFYYGYTNGPYWRVIVWALACTVPFLWWARPDFRSALSTAPPSIIGRSLVVVAIVMMVAVALVAGHSLIYLVALSLNHLHSS